MDVRGQLPGVLSFYHVGSRDQIHIICLVTSTLPAEPSHWPKFLPLQLFIKVTSVTVCWTGGSVVKNVNCAGCGGLAGGCL